MSSLDQERRLEQASRGGPSGETTTRRPRAASGTPAEAVPAQRTRTTSRATAPQAPATRTSAAVKAAAAKAPAGKTSTKKAPATKTSAAVKTAAAKAPVGKASTRKAPAATSQGAKAPARKASPRTAAAKAVTERAGIAGPAAAKTLPSRSAGAGVVVAAGPAAARALPPRPAPATKRSGARRAPVKAVAVAEVAAAPMAAGPAVPARRPTPYRRPRPAAVAERAALPTVEVLPDEEATGIARLRQLARRSARPQLTPPTAQRRPALYLAAALVGALAVGAVTGGAALTEAKAADQVSHSVAVAHELGLTSARDPIPMSEATQRLQELTVSRAQREEEQAAAVRKQAADVQAAVEAARPKAVLPVDGALLTSGFGYRWGTLHAGIDLAAPIGTPEYAVMDGVVLKAGPASGFGLAVYIQHANGDVTVYGHMEKILVTDGQVVHAGDTIALLGALGQSTGPHLHFEVHVGGINGPKIDPIPWLRARGVAI